MSAINTLNGQIASAKSKIYRRCYIKRRLLGTGLYEDDWQDISDDVVSWGSIRKEVDSARVGVFKFSGLNMTFSNRYGRFNPDDNENSLWYGYGDQQRTLVKIQIGFVRETLQDSGIWNYAEFPGACNWDQANWDTDTHEWDTDYTSYMGFISGDINLKADDKISIPIVPLTEVFRQFSARRLTGYSASLTASGFVEMLRDQQDSNGAYIFRPFFGDTSTGFVIETTTVNYTNLSTATAADVIDSNCWDVIQKLAEAENFVPYATSDGTFRFVSREYGGTTSVFHFFGAGGFSSEYGQTIKKVNWFGRRFTKYYSRVQIKFRQEDTSTSYAVEESTFRVSGDSSPWTLGERTLAIDNYWIPTLTVAETIAEELFQEYSAIRTEVEFTTSLVPHLEILNRVQITYDPNIPTLNSLWDQYDWAGETATASDLTWDGSGGDAIAMNGREFRLISIDHNLDTCETKFIGRE